jgi:hypothetical protein
MTRPWSDATPTGVFSFFRDALFSASQLAIQAQGARGQAGRYLIEGLRLEAGRGSNELLRELFEITALSHANTNGVTWGGFRAFALLSLGHTSRPIGLELFAV